MKRVNKDRAVASVFFTLTIALLVALMMNRTFFDWAYERHHNQWSWYIRPVFLVPFCFFAYKRSLAGISITIFCLFTSMFWFGRPDTVSADVMKFLQFEMDWLKSEWSTRKIILIATVPISFIALGLAFWKRSLLMGLGVIVLMASGKIAWSIQNAGDSGKSILVPAITGLIICCVLIFFGFKRLERKER